MISQLKSGCPKPLTPSPYNYDPKSIDMESRELESLWSDFNDIVFGKKRFVKSSIFKTRDKVKWKGGSGNLGGDVMLPSRYRKGQQPGL